MVANRLPAPTTRWPAAASATAPATGSPSRRTRRPPAAWTWPGPARCAAGTSGGGRGVRFVRVQPFRGRTRHPAGLRIPVAGATLQRGCLAPAPRPGVPRRRQHGRLAPAGPYRPRVRRHQPGPWPSGGQLCAPGNVRPATVALCRPYLVAAVRTRHGRRAPEPQLQPRPGTRLRHQRQPVPVDTARTAAPGLGQRQQAGARQHRVGGRVALGGHGPG